MRGVWLNVGKTGINSLSIGGRWVTLNIGRRGVYLTGSIAGTGLSARKRLIKPRQSNETNETQSKI